MFPTLIQSGSSQVFMTTETSMAEYRRYLIGTLPCVWSVLATSVSNETIKPETRLVGREAVVLLGIRR